MGKLLKFSLKELIDNHVEDLGDVDEGQSKLTEVTEALLLFCDFRPSLT